MDVSIGAGARVQLTTTGATRVYRKPCREHGFAGLVSMRVGEGALLEYLPDVLIPFAGSRHVQRTSITLERGATLCWWETLAPGRQARGERFAFERLRIESNIDAAGRPVVRERFLLEPAARALASIARMGEYTHLATFYAVTPARFRAGVGRQAERGPGPTDRAWPRRVGREHFERERRAGPGARDEPSRYSRRTRRILGYFAAFYHR